MTLRILGDNPFSTSGYSVHTKELCKALYELNPDIKLDCQLFPGWERLASDDFFNMITKQSKIEEDTVVAIMQPQLWNLVLSEKPKKFYGWVIWEGMNIPRDWISYLLDKRVNGILVPSTHVWRAIENTATKEEYERIKNKIYQIPHGVDLGLFTPQEEYD